MKKQKNNIKKTIEGVIVSVKMAKTVVVKITRKFPHPLYKKLIKRDSNLSVDSGTFTLIVGDRVKIVEAKPISKTKHFRVLEVIKNGSA
ncbi:MAG: ribosomal protein S17p (S11e) [Candidatus Levybacteria bacterium]|nr:ribosomal protein S17p (S11e) [Candidatus Levybacteria bacterium]